ncbi:MAG: hypothetical protein CMP88_04030 [Gammaproteobacteria bacterium]|nr:hypothetical protein [Gammaproteobacteria bacterium]|tara:strand:+ start:32 stop:490 length:459 start_codon:yes stop_codon:yes gene_type:complete
MINIYEIMQVAVTPVFLLAGIGSLLISMTNRLGRIKDRIRVLQRAVLDHVEIQKSPIFLKAISKLTWRSRFCYFSISLAVSSGLFVCIVILCMFIQGLYGLEISQTVAFLFMLCIALLIFSLVFLVIEIYIATRTIHEKGEDVEALIHRQQR